MTAMLALFAPILVLAALLFVLKVQPWNGRDVSASGSRTRAGRRAALTEAVPVQLLFVEPSGRALQLDCIVLDDVKLAGVPIPSGTPTTIRMRRPNNPVLREWVEALLEGWSEDARVVDVAVVPAAGVPQVRLRSGSSKVQLPVEHSLGAA